MRRFAMSDDDGFLLGGVDSDMSSVFLTAGELASLDDS